MSDTPNQKFKITVPITGYRLRKSADGTEKYVITGMASNTDLDLTGERMAETAIKSMSNSLQTHAVMFKSEHHDDWDAEFGEVTALTATETHELMMEAELDPDHYRTKTLVKALDRGKQLGLSIGGVVVDSAREYVSDLGRMIKTYKDILLEEISVTGSPAVASTWLENINKSVKDWKETLMSENEEVTKTEDQTPTDAPVEQSPAAPESTPDSTPTPSPADPAAPDQKDDVSPDTDPAPDPDVIGTSEVEETKKSLLAATEEVEQLKKSLAESQNAAEDLQKSLADKTTELETVQKSLAEKEAEIEKIEARKAVALNEGVRQAVIVDDQVAKTAEPESIGELYLQSLGAK